MNDSSEHIPTAHLAALDAPFLSDRDLLSDTFTAVQEYVVHWHDPEDEARSRSDGEDLIALEERMSSKGFQYIIVTDCRESMLVTLGAPLGGVDLP